ncbi:MAG: ribonuclease R, partial [Rhizobiaceae bacterium]
MAHRKHIGTVPDRDKILEFIADNPGKSGKREIAREFGIKGNAKIALKAILKELADEGLIEKRGKKLTRAGELPKVTVLDIVTRDGDGGLLAKPVAWNEESDGKPPLVSIKVPRGNKNVTAGIGDRVLARTERISNHGVEYSARVMKRIERSREAILGVVRKSGANFVLEPATKRQEELAIDTNDLGGAEPGDLVEVSKIRAGKYGAKRGRVTSVIGNINGEKAISEIAIHANGIPHIFSESVLAEAKAAKSIKIK